MNATTCLNQSPPRPLYARPAPQSAAPPRLDSLRRQELHDYFCDSWILYETLFHTLQDSDAFYAKPDSLRHPLIFYLGHTAAFFVNTLRLAGLLHRPVKREFDELFAKGVDPKTTCELTELTWPDIHDVWHYRQQVYESVRQVIDRVPLAPVVSPRDCVWAVLMAIEHERLHWETTTVLLRQCPTSVFGQDRPWPYAPTEYRTPGGSLVDVEPGSVVIGKPHSISSFGWDNEYGHLEQHVPAFRIARNLTTNHDYLDFVENGGYAQKCSWSREGWQWNQAVDSRHPKFWIPCPGGFRYRAMFDELEMPLSWPVEVNHFEAEAYCRWKGRGFRLPTEAEYRRLFSQGVLDEDINLVGGPYNNHLRFGSPTPVGMCSADDVVNDLFGNVWQLLQDDFYPLPGFEPHGLYPDFSTPYFGTEHGMMLGGSWATMGTAASPYYRLWFRRFFFQHAGFRVVSLLEED